jgi:hypothetical protein
MSDGSRRAAALLSRLRADGFKALHDSADSSRPRGLGLVLDAATMTIKEVATSPAMDSI